MTGMLRVPRGRGAPSGALLVLLGAWGALIPFVGPYFGYAYTPAGAWTYTSGRLWLSILPGAAVLIGGAVLLITTVRPVAMAGAALASLAGAWFAVSLPLRPLWSPGTSVLGAPLGDGVLRSLEQLGFFTGLGVAVVFLAALALGRLSVLGQRRASAPAGGQAGRSPAATGAPGTGRPTA